jgi:hypothetical protein
VLEVGKITLEGNAEDLVKDDRVRHFWNVPSPLQLPKAAPQVWRGDLGVSILQPIAVHPILLFVPYFTYLCIMILDDL